MGGAEYSTIKLCEELSKEHKVDISFCNNTLWNDGKKDFDAFGCKLHAHKVKQYSTNKFWWLKRYYEKLQWKKIIKEDIEKLKPDLIFTHMRFAPPVIDAAKENGIPVVVFIHYYAHFCPIQFEGKDPFQCDRKCYKCLPKQDLWQYPIIKRSIDWHVSALKKAYLVISVSSYVKQITDKWCGIDSKIIPPFMDLDACKAETRKPEYIYFTPPNVGKGINIVLKIADRMKNEKFLITGRSERTSLDIIAEIRKRDNITYIPWIENKKDLFSSVKLLLMPSLWPEPFGMVAIECQNNGIPVLASNIGALPEVIGEGGLIINNPNDVDSWISAIQKFKEMDFYNIKSQIAIKNVEKIKPKFDFSDFMNMVSK
ncbi:MAG: glycosyltransferase family 4 protein [Candidatus Methanoperedenaceae archaeon]|nr:glycosyltransferase family 4 protein [Candidatus Methanoperedenaceae archaeon]